MTDELDDETQALIEAERNRPDLPDARKRAILEGARAKAIAATERAPLGGASGEAPERGASRLWSGAQLSTSVPTAILYTAIVFGLGIALGLQIGGGEIERGGARSRPFAHLPEEGAPPRVDGGTEAASGGGTVAPAALSFEREPASSEPAPSSSERANHGGARTRAEDVVDSTPSAERAGRREGAEAQVGHAASDRALASERMLVEAAQSAMARGDLRAALESLEAHASGHPSGRMAEEREALAVRLLFDLGREPEARRRAEAFDRRWPSSLLRGLFASRLSEAAPGREGGVSSGE